MRFFLLDSDLVLFGLNVKGDLILESTHFQFGSILKKSFSNFSCMFLNPNIFFQFEF